jgi:hypothetical protein
MDPATPTKAESDSDSVIGIGPPSSHAWSGRALTGDYLRAGAGFAVSFPPLLFVPWTPAVVIILGGLSGLFVWLAARTLWRQRTVIRIDDTGISRGARRIRWTDLAEVRLRRFGGRRKGAGYIEMTVAGGGVSIKSDSEIGDFLTLAARVHGAARRANVAFDARSRAQLQALGLEPPEARPENSA